MVSINYRLGLLGFFAHPELSEKNPHSPSNFGLLDQILALKWMHKYIEFFGGNASDITIFGKTFFTSLILFIKAAPLAIRFFSEISCGAQNRSKLDKSAVATFV